MTIVGMCGPSSLLPACFATFITTSMASAWTSRTLELRPLLSNIGSVFSIVDRVSAGDEWCESHSRMVKPLDARHRVFPARRTVSLMSSMDRRLASHTRSKYGSTSTNRLPESSSASADAEDCLARHILLPHSVRSSSMTAPKCFSTAPFGSSTTACQIPLTASRMFGLGSCCMRYSLGRSLARCGASASPARLAMLANPYAAPLLLLSMAW